MTDPCFDAEIMAAWAERTLDERACVEVERHAAHCARCQAMLAAFVRTERAKAPAAALVPGAALWWQSLRLRWLVPIAAAAAAAAIWIAVPSGPRLENDLAMAPERTPEQTATAPLVDERNVSPAGATQPSPAGTQPRASVGVVPDAAPLAKEAAPAREEAPSEPALSRERTEALASTAERRAAEAAPVAAPEADAQARSQNAFRRALADSAVQGFVSRDGAVRWRLAGTEVERSTDDGATWIAATLGAAPARNEGAAPRSDAAGAAAVAAVPAPPAAAVGAVSPVAVVAGDAPAAAVCWLVGPRGAVWLTVDGGQRFRRLTVSGEPDLRSVTARDARSAEVTASDGRVFRTDDAGLSWRLTSP